MDYDLSVLGNLDGFDENNVTDSLKHTTNATNEITQIDYSSPAGASSLFGVHNTYLCAR